MHVLTIVTVIRANGNHEVKFNKEIKKKKEKRKETEKTKRKEYHDEKHDCNHNNYQLDS